MIEVMRQGQSGSQKRTHLLQRADLKKIGRSTEPLSWQLKLELLFEVIHFKVRIKSYTRDFF